MKKTFNINLAGFPFIIDEDAYHLLKDYLDTIRYAFETSDDTAELAADIESRVAEILLEDEARGIRIITVQEVSNVIERIGRPSEFIEVEEISISQENPETDKESETPSPTPPPYNPEAYSRNPFVRKRMYRDPQNSMLGGVCAGLAAYLNIDVTLVRVIAVLLFILSGTTVAIVYIILWIVLPPANTTLQRMQMKGEDPTMANIGKTVKETFRNDNNQVSQVSSSQKSLLEKIISVFVKCLIILGFIITVPLLFVLAATLIGCMIAVFVIGIGIFSGGMFDSFNEGLMVLFILLAVIGGTITLGVPIWLLIRKLWKKREEPMSQSTQRSILIVWLIGIAMTAIFSVKAVKTGNKLNHRHWGFNIENIQELNEMDEKDLKDILIEDGKIYITTKDGKKITVFHGNVKVENGTEEEESDVTVVSDLPEDSISQVEMTTDSIN